MVDFRILNGSRKCTLIERFNSAAVVLLADEKNEFDDLDKAKNFIRENGLEVNVAHIFGLPISARRTDHGN